MEKVESIKLDLYSLINTVALTRTYVQGKPKTEIFFPIVYSFNVSFMTVVTTLPLLRGGEGRECFCSGRESFEALAPIVGN